MIYFYSIIFVLYKNNKERVRQIIYTFCFIASIRTIALQRSSRSFDLFDYFIKNSEYYKIIIICFHIKHDIIKRNIRKKIL